MDPTLTYWSNCDEQCNKLEQPLKDTDENLGITENNDEKMTGATQNITDQAFPVSRQNEEVAPEISAGG